MKMYTKNSISDLEQLVKDANGMKITLALLAYKVKKLVDSDTITRTQVSDILELLKEGSDID